MLSGVRFYIQCFYIYLKNEFIVLLLYKVNYLNTELTSLATGHFGLVSTLSLMFN